MKGNKFIEKQRSSEIVGISTIIKPIVISKLKIKQLKAA
jgi:hypothetical protein